MYNYNPHCYGNPQVTQEMVEQLFNWLVQNAKDTPAEEMLKSTNDWITPKGLSELAAMYMETPPEYRSIAKNKILESLSIVQEKTGVKFALPPTFPPEIAQEWNAMQNTSSTDPRGTMPKEGGEAVAIAAADPRDRVIQTVRERLLFQSNSIQRAGMSISCGTQTALQKKTRQLAIHNMLNQLKLNINNGRAETPIALYQTCVANPRLDLSSNPAFLLSLDAEIARTAEEPEIATQTTTVASVKGKQGMDALVDELPLLAAHGAAGALFGKAFFDKPIAGAIAAPVIMHFLSPLMKKL